MMRDFTREHRYYVVERKRLTPEQDQEVQALCQRLQDEGIPPQDQCVVVEKDWPIYEPVWEMVQRVAEGKAPESVPPEEGLPVAVVGADPVSRGMLKQIAERMGVTGAPPQDQGERILEALDGLLGAVAAGQAIADQDRVEPVFTAGTPDHLQGWQSQMGRDLHVALKRGRAALIHHEAEVIGSLRFPTMLRKMWSGGEMQAWIGEQAEERRRQAEATP